MIERSDVIFESGGLRCAAWLYRPDTTGNCPLLVMGHGLGGTRELALAPFAERFCEAGLAVLVFDYRYYGGSEGEPREWLSVSRQLEDWRNAIAFAKTLPGIDAQRIGIWGSSFGGGHVMTLAAEDLGLAAAVSQVPFSNGLASSLRVPPLTTLGILGNATLDLLKAAFGGKPQYIQLVGHPGEVALMSAPDSWDGYKQLVPAEAEQAGRWHNQVTARTGLEVTFYSPDRSASKVTVPFLLVVAEDDSIAPAKPSLKAAAKMARAEVKRYPGGHFDFYMRDGFERIVADELDFLRRHLLEARP